MMNERWTVMDSPARSTIMCEWWRHKTTEIHIWYDLRNTYNVHLQREWCIFLLKLLFYRLKIKRNEKQKKHRNKLNPNRMGDSIDKIFILNAYVNFRNGKWNSVILLSSRREDLFVTSCFMLTVCIVYFVHEMRPQSILVVVCNEHLQLFIAFTVQCTAVHCTLYISICCGGSLKLKVPIRNGFWNFPTDFHVNLLNKIRLWG